MTANRWWVKAAARWLARFDTTKTQLQAISLAITAFSTFSLVLQNAGLGEYVPHLGVVAGLSWIVYTYYYAEGGVHNQKQRDMVDLSDNYSGPTMALDALIESKQLAYLAYAIQNGEQQSLEELQSEMREISLEEWKALRNGLDEDLLQ